MQIRKWVKLPTAWINDESGLHNFRWTGERRANNIAALMVLVTIAHHAEDESGAAKLTYDKLSQFTGLSRSKISGGLDVLEKNKLIERGTKGKGTYQLCNYTLERGWAKLPAKGLYDSASGGIAAFQNFHLRKRVELDSLKLYLLFAARRGRDTNMANISYDNICKYAGVHRDHIKSALSLLAANGLVHVEHVPSMISDYGVSNAYRLTHLDTYKHMGTVGRNMDTFTENKGEKTKRTIPF